MRIAALVTNYNTWLDATQCAREIVRHSGDHVTRIIIVDDASTQEAPDDLPPQAEIIHNEENRGYVASVNTGFARLDEEVVVLFDSDAYPLMDVTVPLAEAFASNERLGALGFRLVDRNGNATGAQSPEPIAAELLLGQKLSGMLHRWRSSGGERRPLCLHSCGMAVRRTAFENVGGFDEGFDFLDADMDFSMRLRRSGWEVKVNSGITAFHEGDGSPQSTAKRVVRHHKNRWHLLKKHGLLRHPHLLRVGLAIRHALEYGLLRLAGRRLFPDPVVRSDKLKSRRQLLKLVRDGYEP